MEWRYFSHPAAFRKGMGEGEIRIDAEVRRLFPISFFLFCPWNSSRTMRDDATLHVSRNFPLVSVPEGVRAG